MRGMIARLLSFLALAALLLMPLVPAQAAARANAAMTMAMSGHGHCGHQLSAPDKAVPSAHCGAACALVLPEVQHSALAFPAGQTLPIPARLSTLAGRTPRLATPPPKRG